ncbi:MAG: Nif3-like dinuclear metal center hexameric protein [candidate division KSB1 bacterium]|nr:Nif3-like dinuclear metal center hexameric protein [candidate division KSB1 bacterium]MDZ7334383.1 Nif3-like dinuclear metal center hexameric protein [candidate division KSB1 bacterium]MDZ7358267.1 Nif3-like dinuclear metal center hexameric protein [candidate division KSB1 bacterium]MDZ7375264.1 Nif3-like dinuclear metal center hexameric protein [candidate division KSB1 bacterium]MDZ7398810.1 Nif3-like dinuclear metal center hexameric protein [candidate division KSB1 bacterium]
MVKRDELIGYINELLNINEFPDDSINGLQVEGKTEIERVILGVSVSERLFRAAVERGADLILVHHGLFWRKAPAPYLLTGLFRTRVALLIKNDINLAAYHLPLDAHAELGNNAQILKRLAIDPIKPIEVGYLGRLRNPIAIEKWAKIINKQLETTAQVFAFGPNKVQRVLVISGSSSRFYHLALEHGADTFLGGDMRENVVREIEEVGLNFIHAGHYNTEKFGIQALGEKLQQEFALRCEFIDIPNPV